jgi:membrane associated rhomboid family serine protease
MLPIRDLNPRRRFPILVLLLIAVNALVFFWEMTLSVPELEEAFRDLAVVPDLISDNPFSLESILDVIRSMFMHGGYEHILGNMLYLYLFGDNIEDRFGRILFLVLYFLSGFVAVAAQVAIDPDSMTPMVGASGAIAGVLGSYLVLFPTVKVQGIIPIGRMAGLQEWPALVVLGMWFILQLLSGIASLGADYAEGGFLAGIVFTLIFMRIYPQPDKDSREQMLYERAQRYSV